MPLIHPHEVEHRHLVVEGLPKSLLTTGNPKTAKGEGYGFLTAIMHFAPAKLAGFEVCSGRTVGCTASCLVFAGRGAFDPKILDARIRRTKFFRADREAFMARLEKEIRSHVKRAAKHGLKPAVRLNGTSDIPWENVKYGDAKRTIFETFPDVQFYDYTKLPMRAKKILPPNYDLTFSLAESNERAAEYAASKGMRVAVVFGNADAPGRRKWNLPATFKGMTVIDADAHDLRFTEDQGVVCGLKAKGHARKDQTGFVQWVKPA
jgi:hypothetical protein